MSNIDVPLDPAEDEPSLLNEFTHAEFQRVYEDASANIRFAKQQQWHTIVYFSAGAIAAVAYGHVTAWSDQQLIFYLMLLIWFLSLISALVVLSLQWWQGAEHRKIDYIASKWSCFVNAARAQVSQAQRHPALRHVPVHAFLSRAGDHRRDPNLLAPDLIPTPRRQSRRRSW